MRQLARVTTWVGWLALIGAEPAWAQDALNGKRLYLDVARLRGTGVSCVDCHGGLPGGAFGIGRAANDPAAVERAVNSVPQMIPLRGRMGSNDYADLAAFIGQPGVPSPVLRVTTAAMSNADRIDFGTVVSSQASTVAEITLANDGAVALYWTSDARIVGTNAADFRLVRSTCIGGTTLNAGADCVVSLAFVPGSEAAGLRTAAMQIDHDWVGGASALALLGTAASSSAVPPVAGVSSGGGGVAPGWILGAAVAGLWGRHLGSARARSATIVTMKDHKGESDGLKGKTPTAIRLPASKELQGDNR